MEWITLKRYEPQRKCFRARCTEAACPMAAQPMEFVARDSAEAWARAHANQYGHVAVMESRELPAWWGPLVTWEDYMRGDPAPSRP